MYSEKSALYKQNRRQKFFVNGLCMICGKQPLRTGKKSCEWCSKAASSYYARHKQESAQKHQTARAVCKSTIFARYGKSCRCCGEDREVFLTIDHINGGGNKERLELTGRNSGGGGLVFYRHLIKRGLPDGYQTLCWNCNVAKHYLGACPHQAAKISYEEVTICAPY